MSSVHNVIYETYLKDHEAPEDRRGHGRTAALRPPRPVRNVLAISGAKSPPNHHAKIHCVYFRIGPDFRISPV